MFYWYIDQDVRTLLTHPGVAALNLTIVVLFGWRLWRFTIVPFIFPNSPKVYPYWVPCQ